MPGLGHKSADRPDSRCLQFFLKGDPKKPGKVLDVTVEASESPWSQKELEKAARETQPPNCVISLWLPEVIVIANRPYTVPALDNFVYFPPSGGYESPFSCISTSIETWGWYWAGDIAKVQYTRGIAVNSVQLGMCSGLICWSIAGAAAKDVLRSVIPEETGGLRAHRHTFEYAEPISH
ncbi:hypothetical protein C8R45DRAFT_924316 [Mycena sanguinolenta]|nr:hypothetical protein C8R45DRAFT_924316 [Mycena sanguinolenta]